MSNTNAITPLIQPSQNDVNGGVANDGKRALEKYVRELFKALNGISYQISGNALPTTAADLVLIVPAGSAYISGYYVTWAQTNVTLPASSTSHIFVKLIFASNLASNVQIEDNTSGTHPADAIKLGTVVTSGSAITSSTDQRLLDGNQRIRRTVFTATTTWIVPANITRIRVRLFGAGGGGGGGGGGALANTGGAGAYANAGGYVEGIVTVTPGASVTVTVGAGGSGGGGGATLTAGGSGGSGGTTSAVGTGFNWGAGGGAGGAGGGAATDSPAADGVTRTFAYSPGTTAASAGTPDVQISGGGRAGGAGNVGGSPGNSGSGGAAGGAGVAIIEY